MISSVRYGKCYEIGENTMRVFAIRDEFDVEQKDLAYLLYYEIEKYFYIELPEEADSWETPLLLESFLKRGEKTVNSYWSKVWVRQRIVPEDRQNLAQVLKENGLEEYDEFELLLAGKGRCAQDNYYLEEITEETLLVEFSYRYDKRIEDVVCLEEDSFLVFFRDGKVKKIDARKLEHTVSFLSRILKYKEMYKKITIQPGGYGVQWGEREIISRELLYSIGVDIPLSIQDFRRFVSDRVVETSEAMELLSCSRQNINDLIKRGKITPIKRSQKNTLFLKSEILKRNWK